MQVIDELKDGDGCLDLDSIKKIIPYEKPFIFLDKVLNLEKNRIVAVKEAKPDEEFFKGHFVDFPIMPGALIIEGLGQAGTLLVRYNLANHKDKDVLAYKIKDAEFKAPVFPGMQIKYDVNLIASDERGGVMTGKVFCDGKLMAEASFIVAVVDKKEFRSKYNSGRY